MIIREDQPTYILESKGAEHLTTTNLINMIVFGSKLTEQGREIISKLLIDADYKLNKLVKYSYQEIQIFGFTKLQAQRLKSAFELAPRIEHHTELLKIRSPQDTFEVIRSKMKCLNTEHFYIITLNQGNYIIKTRLISTGGITSTIVDPRVIFKQALLDNASSIIVAHNHPSGNLNPSNADLKITKNLVEAGSFLNIKVLDSMIITDHGYYSFSEKDLI